MKNKTKTSFNGKKLVEFNSTVRIKIPHHKDKVIIILQFDRNNQLHDISPRILETKDYTYSIFNDLHGQPRKFVEEYISQIV